jgi:hypothetical protein
MARRWHSSIRTTAYGSGLRRTSAGVEVVGDRLVPFRRGVLLAQRRHVRRVFDGRHELAQGHVGIAGDDGRRVVTKIMGANALEVECGTRVLHAYDRSARRSGSPLGRVMSSSLTAVFMMARSTR